MQWNDVAQIYSQVWDAAQLTCSSQGTNVNTYVSPSSQTDPFFINNRTSGYLLASSNYVYIITYNYYGLDSPSPIECSEMTRDCSNLSLRTANSRTYSRIQYGCFLTWATSKYQSSGKSQFHYSTTLSSSHNRCPQPFTAAKGVSSGTSVPFPQRHCCHLSNEILKRLSLENETQNIAKWIS